MVLMPEGHVAKPKPSSSRAIGDTQCTETGGRSIPLWGSVDGFGNVCCYFTLNKVM